MRSSVLRVCCMFLLILGFGSKLGLSQERSSGIGIYPKNRSLDPHMGSSRPTLTPEQRTKYIQIFFATNRVIDRAAESAARDRGRALAYEDLARSELSNIMSFGWVEVEYPANRKKGDPTYGINSTLQSSLHHFSISKHDFFRTPELFNRARLRLAREKSGTPLLYVHGYNNSFSDAAERLAQLTVDLEIKVPTIFFSWPSDSGRLTQLLPPLVMSENNYHATKETLLASRLSVGLVVGLLTSATSDRLHLLGHSMGGKLTAESLVLRADMALSANDAFRNPDATIGTIVLAAPDIGTRRFKEKSLSKLLGPNRRLVVYCSDDRVLAVSKQYNKSDDRLGFCRRSGEAISGIDHVFVTGRIRDFARHSYYLGVLNVLDDIDGRAFVDHCGEQNCDIPVRVDPRLLTALGMGQHLSISYKLSSDQGVRLGIELRGLMQSLGDLRQLVGLKTPAIIELLGSNPGDNINWVWYLFGSKNAGHSSEKLLPMIVERVVFKYSHGPLAKCKDIPPAHEVLVRPASLEVTAKDTQRLKDWVHLSKKGCGEDFVFWIRWNPKTLPEEVAKRDQLFDTLGKLSVYDRLVDSGAPTTQVVISDYSGQMPLLLSARGLP